MLKQHRYRARLGIGIYPLGAALNMVLYYSGINRDVFSWTWPPNIVVSAILLWGCIHYAKAKGYSGAVGLLGLLQLGGLIVLAFLPNRQATPRVV